MEYNMFNRLINQILPFTESINNGQGERDNYVNFEVTSEPTIFKFKIRLFFGKHIFFTTFLGTSEECLKLKKDLHSIMFTNGLFVIDDYDRIKPSQMDIIKEMELWVSKRGL